MHNKVVAVRFGQLILVIFLVAQAAFANTSLRAAAQASLPNFSDVITISSNDQTAEQIYAFSDLAGDLHVIWIAAETRAGEKVKYLPEDFNSFYYRRLRQGNWSEAVNILYIQTGMQMLRGIVDQQGFVHIFWVSTGCIYHQKSLELDAALVRAWQGKANCIADAPITQFNVAVDKTGVFYMVYTDPQAVNVILAKSVDGGETWQSSTITNAVGPRSVYVGLSSIAIDQRDRLHVVWLEYPADFYPHSGIYYSRSDDGGDNWSEALFIAGDSYSEPNIAAYGEDTLHIIYGASADLAGRYDRYSVDGGGTWSLQYTLVDPNDQMTGLAFPPAIAVDSAGGFHFFATVECGGRYVSWNPQLHSYSDLITLPVFCYNAQAAITGGNTLHLISLNDQRGKVVYTSGKVFAPASEAIPFPTPAPQPTAIPVINTPEATATPLGLEQLNTAQPYQPTNQNTPLIVGALAGLILIVISYFGNRLRRRAR